MILIEKREFVLTQYSDGEKRYILQPRGIRIGDEILSSPDAPIVAGNTVTFNQYAIRNNNS
jgi:ribosomal protein L2